MEKKRARVFFMTLAWVVLFICNLSSDKAAASSVPQSETPTYKVGYYAFDCYHMQDEDGRRYGYGYEMMQNISKYLQCTFSYVGYDKTNTECEEMLKNGEIDILTATKITPERQKYFTFTTHPAITATTCMNVKAGNTSVKAGDYSTYEGLRVGLLERHTYNDSFKEFAKEKGFSCEIVYYETPTELTNALIDGEVDALVNSYIRTPEDEWVIEDFGQTPYYIMARKEDQDLIDQLDAAIDSMNVETPNWRVELYNKYYGSEDLNTEYTKDEEALLKKMQENDTVVKAVMNPDGAPYSWYEDGEAKGIAADLFRETADTLGLKYEILPAADREEYESLLNEGAVDVWMDVDSAYEAEEAGEYKLTEPYLTTTVSVIHLRDFSGRISKVAVVEDCTSIRAILSAIWPGAELVVTGSKEACEEAVLNGKVDGALMMTYTAQKIRQEDIQNRLSVDIVPGASMELRMGVNAKDNNHFYGLWEKTLADVSSQLSAEVVQSYTETVVSVSVLGYLYSHPTYLVLILSAIFLLIFLSGLYIQTNRNRKKQQKIADELAVALEEAKEANEAKLTFFSKMSHDIRTPLNVVLGMTQMAQKYKNDPNAWIGRWKISPRREIIFWC